VKDNFTEGHECNFVSTVSFTIFFQCSSGFILYHCIYGCMFCMLPFNFVKYVVLLLCIFIITLCFLSLA
jgi:hypothetical protein